MRPRIDDPVLADSATGIERLLDSGLSIFRGFLAQLDRSIQNRTPPSLAFRLRVVRWPFELRKVTTKALPCFPFLEGRQNLTDSEL